MDTRKRGWVSPALGAVLGAAAVLMFASTAATAADFDWMRDLNVMAQADPSGFRARIAARFKIGNAEIDAVIGNVARPADAYMVFRLGEMARRPPAYILERYKGGKHKGWGALAKSLGIKPGSSEFHALKRGHDLEGGRQGKEKGKGKPGKGR